ncbi:MAG TPA: PQQ-binding-like beta-propeller repeat protein, partial [Rubricoccaceae bacterium]
MRRAALLSGALLLLGGCGSIQVDRPLVPAAPSAAPTPPLVEVWEVDVEGAFGPAAAAVGGGRIAIGDRKGDVVVLDGPTGRRVGRLSFGASIEGGLVLSPDGLTVYVPVARGRAGVVAYAVREGARRWTWRPDSAAQSVDAGVALTGDVVVAALHDGSVVGLDAAVGTERWRQPGADRAQNHASPVALTGGLVAVADDQGAVRALDAATGAVRWTGDVGAPVYAAPALATGRLFVPTTRGH